MQSTRRATERSGVGAEGAIGFESLSFRRGGSYPQTMDQGTVTGIFALGGVLVGGLTNNLAALAAERRQRDRAAKVVGRMLTDDIFEAYHALARAIELCNLGALVDRHTSVESYRARREELAAALRPEQWLIVSTAYQGLTELVAQAHEDGDAQVNTATLSWMRVVHDELEHAGHVLIEVGNHGARRRRLAKRYWHLRHLFAERRQTA